MRPVPEYDPKAWLLKALRETAHAMESLVWDIDEDLLDQRTNVGEWSAQDLLLHMSGMERSYAERLERIARLDEPSIEAFDGDSIEPTRAELHMTAYDLLDEFGVRRQQSVYLLWSLDEDDWERTGRHPYLGPVSILQTAREMNEHDLGHLWQLRRICDHFARAAV